VAWQSEEVAGAAESGRGWLRGALLAGSTPLLPLRGSLYEVVQAVQQWRWLGQLRVVKAGCGRTACCMPLLPAARLLVVRLRRPCGRWRWLHGAAESGQGWLRGALLTACRTAYCLLQEVCIGCRLDKGRQLRAGKTDCILQGRSASMLQDTPACT
jgi:hypothetical protein